MVHVGHVLSKQLNRHHSIDVQLDLITPKSIAFILQWIKSRFYSDFITIHCEQLGIICSLSVTLDITYIIEAVQEYLI